MPYLAELNGEQINSLAIPKIEFDALQGHDLACVCCHGPMHLRYSRAPYKTPHFVHNSLTEVCPTSESNMSPEHLAVQALVHAAINKTAPWQGHVEYPGDGWRGDVVATRPDNSSIVSFEVQLAPMSPAKMHERTRKHLATGVSRVVWLCGRDYLWADEVPSARLHMPPGWKPQQGLDLTCKTLPGPAEIQGEPHHLETVRLEQFVAAILSKRILARYEEKVASRFGSKPAVVEANSWLFETTDQVVSKTNERAVAATELAQRRARMVEEQSKLRHLINIENYLKAKRTLVEILSARYPGTVFDEGNWTTAEGAVAEYRGKIIVAQPVQRRINPHRTPDLFYNSVITIFLDNKRAERLAARYPNINVHAWQDLHADTERIFK